MSQEALGYDVVDGDGHIVLPDEWWKPYLPQKYWEWAPKGVQEAEGRTFTGHWESPPKKFGYYPGADDPNRAV